MNRPDDYDLYVEEGMQAREARYYEEMQYLESKNQTKGILNMNLDKLYKMQEELDQHILEKHNIKMSKEELLDNTILALLVEVGELANTTRCFKHWSTKGMMEKEIVLDELADVLHFYLSIGNQTGEKYLGGGLKGNFKEVSEYELSEVFINIYYLTSVIGMHLQDLEYHYSNIGIGLEIVAYLLNFTDKEVEQAYLKKHEENYKRQREGY